jgi:hypothetical protein
VDLNPDAAYDCRFKSRKAKIVLQKEKKENVKKSLVFVSFLYKFLPFAKARLLLRKKLEKR